MERLEQQIKFILEIDKLKKIVRQTYLSDCSRKENDAEHSWHLALMCILLSEYSNEEIDILHTVTMVLIHDIIEIDAGDTYAYDTLGYSTKQEREKAAADRIFQILPEEQSIFIRGLWDEFEACITPEAKFAAAMDRIQPLLLNDSSGGLSWREHGVSISQVLDRNQHTHLGSEKLWEYAKKIIDKNAENGNLTN